MSVDPIRHIGHADFHDGHILSLIRVGNRLTITVEGSSGNRYAACFEGVTSFESESPEGMTLYALNEAGAESDLLRRFEFVNWYADEPEDDRARAHLRILAKSFTITALSKDE